MDQAFGWFRNSTAAQLNSWNDRFSHWERAESSTETVQIERARDMVQGALSSNRWLIDQGVRIVQQGSFTNRTNTRRESDIDLRVQHPSIFVSCGPGIDLRAAYAAGGYTSTGFSFAGLRDEIRTQIGRELRGSFGRHAVDESGKKAIRVNGLSGSRAEVDVVPSFTLHRIQQGSLLTGGAYTTVGVAILSLDGTWTLNYPDQHIANGRAKRLATGLQFKRVVRIIKRLQSDMIANEITDGKIPSFLIECLVYLVEDGYFTNAGDDRYDRVKRVLRRIQEKLQLRHDWSALGPREINGIKPLFETGQAWTKAEAIRFVDEALHHLGDA
jgi:hypothetical protein